MGERIRGAIPPLNEKLRLFSVPLSPEIEIRQIPGRDHRRGQWNKEAVCEGRHYLLGASKLGSNWIVRAKDVETGEVLTDQSLDLRENLPAQKKLVLRLHEKSGAAS